MGRNYEIQAEQLVPALRRKDVQFRKSTEFIYKNKKLRNAIPAAGSDDGTQHFVSANPKLTKILLKKKKQDEVLASQHDSPRKSGVIDLMNIARSKKRMQDQIAA